MDQQNYQKLGTFQKQEYLIIMSAHTQFFCLFSAFSSVQNSVAMLFEQEQQSNLGIYSLLTLYLVFGVGALLAPNISLIFRASHLMCISALGFSGYIASGLLVAHCSGGKNDGICSQGSVYTIVIIAAMICGFGAATIWVSQAWYISRISSPANRGFSYGIFFAGMQSSQIMANVLSALLLKEGAMTYFLVMTGVAGASSLSFMLLPNLPSENDDPSQQKTVGERISSACRISQDPQMIPLLFYYILEGAIVAFYIGFLFRIIVNSVDYTSLNDLNVKVAYVFICLGSFEFVGGLLSGILADRFNRFFLASASTILVELAITFSIVALYQKSYALCFVSAGLWGLSDCIVQNLCTVLSSTLFPNQIEVFAVMRLVQGLSISFHLILSIYIEEQIYYIIVVSTVMIFSYVFSAKIGVKNEKFAL